MSPPFEPRALIVAGSLLARVGLASMLNELAEVDVVGQVAGGESLLDDLDIYRPDVVVIDLGYEPGDLLESVAALAEVEMPVVALVQDAENIAVVMAALRGLNAWGLLLREGDPLLIAAAIQSVYNGLVTFDPALAGTFIPDESDLPAPLREELTPREDEVLRLLARGLTNRAIGQALDISPNTVKFHVNAILSKLNAQSRTEAVVRATQLGLLTL